MECLPTEMALAVLEDQDEPVKVEFLHGGDLFGPAALEVSVCAQPKKIALRDDVSPLATVPCERGLEQRRDLSVPAFPPHSPPPDMPPSLPGSLSAPDPPTPPPFVPALQPAREPTLPYAMLPSCPPASLPPPLPPAPLGMFPGGPPPPFPPLLPATAAPTAPPMTSPGFSAGMAALGLYGDAGARLQPEFAAPAAAFQWYPPLPGAAHAPQHHLRGELAYQPLDIPSCGPAPSFYGLPPQIEAKYSSTNPGSALHGTGDCHPCAWFWKLPGCRNGANCDHCHLCPEGEVKARKKARQSMKRLGLATPQKSTDTLDDAPSPVQQKAPPAQPASPGSSELESTTGSASDREWTAGSGSGSEHEPLGDSDREDAASPPPPSPPPGVLLPPPGLGLPVDLPSRGAALHTAGECSPCAWFWKAVGCNNGRDCPFCHACPQGAAKARKKSRRARGGAAGGAQNAETAPAGVADVAALPAPGC